jgi:hypothetical protein
VAVVDPVLAVDSEAAGERKRRKSRGMLSIFGSGYDPSGDPSGSRSNFFPGRRSSNAFSPVDVTPLPENGGDVVTKKPKKKKSKGGLATNFEEAGDKSVTPKALLIPGVTRPSDARRHSVSVVITAPPIPAAANAGRASPPASHSRRRRRSQGIPPSFDYSEAMATSLRYRTTKAENDDCDDRDADDDCDAEDVTGRRYIRPPIVVVTSQKRKFSLQCDYDVRNSMRQHPYQNLALAATWSSGNVSACHRGDWSYGS